MNSFAKWLFAVLLLGNIGLWLWANGVRPASVPVTAEPRPELEAGKMRLLAQSCLRLGPFTEPAAAEAAAARLRADHLAFARQSESQNVVGSYRVYLPPLPSREAADRKRRELTRRGFKDHSLMQEPGMENAISLGTFAVEANAQKRLQALAAKKVEAQLQTLPQTRTMYWFALAPGDAPGEVLARLRTSDWGEAGVKLESSACPAGG